MKKYIHTTVTTTSLRMQDIEGMSRIGEVKMRGTQFEIYVNTDDAGKIPHFHVRCKDNWLAFHTCVKITSPEYFLHGNKQDTFNSKECRALQDFMQQPTKKKLFGEDGNRMNNWQYTCMLWDDNNSDVEIDPEITQPDYILLK